MPTVAIERSYLYNFASPSAQKVKRENQHLNLHSAAFFSSLRIRSRSLFRVSVSNSEPLLELNPKGNYKGLLLVAMHAIIR